jgi:hypothetical protein
MTRRRTGALVVAGLLVALVLAGVVSYWASSSPDGLEKVAAEHGLDAQARDHDLETTFSDYSTAGVDDDRWSVAVAGVVGVGVTFAVFGGLTWVLRRRTDASTRA